MLIEKLSVREYDFDSVFFGVTLKLMDGVRLNLKVKPTASTLIFKPSSSPSSCVSPVVLPALPVRMLARILATTGPTIATTPMRSSPVLLSK